jgi:beta-RFAP synthase
MAIEYPRTHVRVRPAASLQVRGPDAPRAERYARRLLAHLQWQQPVAIDVLEAIPAHAGLGSGTQLALALGRALALHAGRRLGAAETAALLERGGRSGIGVGAFESGGFIVDGGKYGGEAGGSGISALLPPPVVARHPVPAAWRVVLVYDSGFRGLSGQSEREAFRELARRSPEGVEVHAMLVLMGMLPALLEGDIRAFGEAVTELQRRVGDHFAPAQGGRFASPAVTEVLAWLRQQGVHGVGQSSWGPTGFGICADEDEARAVVAALEGHRRADASLSFAIATPRNTPGGVVPVVERRPIGTAAQGRY